MRSILRPLALCLALSAGCSGEAGNVGGDTTTAFKAITNVLDTANYIKASALAIFAQLEPLLPDETVDTYKAKFNAALAEVTAAINAAHEAIDAAGPAVSDEGFFGKETAKLISAGQHLQAALLEIRSAIPRDSRKLSRGSRSDEPAGLEDFNKAVQQLEQYEH